MKKNDISERHKEKIREVIQDITVVKCMHIHKLHLILPIKDLMIESLEKTHYSPLSDKNIHALCDILGDGHVYTELLAKEGTTEVLMLISSIFGILDGILFQIDRQRKDIARLSKAN